jgi:hypothetical protein
MKEIQKVTLNLNAEGNYAPQQAKNMIDFYGWEDYVPLKGKVGEKEDKYRQSLDYTGPVMSGELRQVDTSFEGRNTDSTNPLIQVMVDASIATARAGRPELTQTIMNAINQGYIKGKVLPEVYTFADKYNGRLEDAEALASKGRLLHYAPDGNIYVLEVKDLSLLEAIRRTYEEAHPTLDILNSITSIIGQMHTRYNPAFPVLNFVRDSLTNAYVITADMGVKNTFSYMTRIAQQVVGLGMVKTNKVSRAYARGDIAEIRRMAKTDPYIKDMMDYLDGGGMISFTQGLTVASNLQKLDRELGPNKIIKTKEQIDRLFDGWVGTFELSARIAAYQTYKTDYLANRLPGAKTSQERAQIEKAAIEKATVYAKRLANFEEVGKHGKAIGAAFMFFRPSSTGAVRALESIAPLFRSLESVRNNLPDYIKKDPVALTEFETKFKKQKKAAAGLMAALGGMGATVFMMSVAMSGSDDEDRNYTLNDDLSRWTRFARFDIGGGKVVQIPWGFGLGGMMAAGAQVAGMFTSKENTAAQSMGNLLNISLDSFLPLPISRINPSENFGAFLFDSITPSVARPFFEYQMNLNAFGQEIYNNRQSRYGDAYTGGDNIPEMYKDAARLMFDSTNGEVDISPNSMYFFANNYFDGLSRMAQNFYGAGLTLAGDKEFDAKRDLQVLESFISNYSKVDQRAFARVENEVREKEKRLNTSALNPEQYLKYIEANPYDKMIVSQYNSLVNRGLKNAREKANKIRRMPGLSTKERKELIDELVEIQNQYKHAAVTRLDILLEMSKD